MSNPRESDLPSEQRAIIDYSILLAQSFQHWVKRDLLIPPPLAGEGRVGVSLNEAKLPTPSPNPSRKQEGDIIAHALYHAPFALVSHSTEADPVFRYANRKAQELFGYSWDEFITLPSRLSAEPASQEERQRLLERAHRFGYVDDYSGVRIGKNGRRFDIRDTILWNVVDGQGNKHGQAAMISTWQWR